MKVTNEKVENRQAFLTVEMEPAEVADYEDKAYKSLVKKVNIPGFRRGKATRAMLERYLGKEKLTEESMNILIPDAYKKAVAQEKIEPFAQPTVNIEKTEPVIFKAVIPLAPIVNVGDYQSIKMEPEPVNVTEENVNAAMEQLRHQNATWEPVERPVEYADMVVIDINSNIEGQTFFDRKGAQYQVMKDSPLPAPGFPAEIVGMKRDEEKEFKLKFPADYARPELANKEASFKVKVVEIKQEKMPDVNEDFVKIVNAEFKTVDELRKAVSDDLKRQLDDRARLDFEDKVVGKVLEISSVEFPPVLTQVETDNMIRADMQRMETDNFQEFQNTIGKTEKQLREQLEPEAKQNVIRRLVLDKIAQAEKITVTHDEIDEELDNMVESTEQSQRKNLEDYLSTDRAHETIGGILISRKTVEHLAKMARGIAGGAVVSTPESTIEGTIVNAEEEKREETK